MLNEEVKRYRELSGDNNPHTPISRIGGYLDGYEKALEQEPCEDAISRQAVEDAIYEYSRACDVNYAQIMKYIDKLPSVNPQEPFMNKPCVAHQVCHKDKVRALDKIRAEIEEERKGYPPSADEYKTINKVLQIINKHIGESE